MAVTCSLQLSCKPGIYKNSNYNQFKRLDALSFDLLNSVHRPKHSVPSRYNVFVCRSLLVPAGTTDVLRTAANAFTRSCNNGNPLVLQFVPALGVIVFAVWGIAPLVRYSRKLFLRESDNNWRSSHAHHVTTSYLQPLLMWTGMTLIYRAVDPVVLTSQTSQAVKQRLLVFLRSLSNVLGIAYCVSSLIQQAQKVFMEKNDPRDMKYIAFQLAWNGVYSAVWVAAASLFMELLGFPTQKWLTAGGLGTVFLTLAGRELVTDFLSSVMIHTTRPFVVNEWIQTRIEGYDVSGTVESVGWWGPTVIRGDDREAVHIPNHKFTVNVVRNLSQKTHWRIKTHLAISHLDVNKINNIVADMRKVLSKNPQVEQQKLHRRVFLESINPENQALMILISCFVKTSRFEEYLCVKEAVTLDLLRIISHHRARLATPIRTYQQSPSDADMENIPFSENMYSRARATNNRRLLLIDPAYKVNSDKAKAQSGSLRTNEEQDNKVTATVASISKADEAVATKFDSKSDTQVAEMAVEADYKVIETPISEPKEDTSPDLNEGLSQPMPEVAVVSSLDTRSNSEVAAKLANLKDKGPARSTSHEKKSNKQLKKVSSGDVQENSMVDGARQSATVSAPSSKFSHEGLDSRDLDAKESTRPGAVSEKPSVSMDADTEGISSATSRNQQESERSDVSSPAVTRSSLEGNIVLDMALEGSRRTLPIEEDHPPPTSAETKELAAIGNGNGSSSNGKDKKENAVTPD